LTVLCSEIRFFAKPQNVGVHCKKTKTDDRMIKEFLLHKDKKMITHRTFRHIWLPHAQATATLPKEPSFCQRTDKMLNLNNYR
ncbi:MAG: hypothetical protein LC109_05955, partial [Bacteroidia bacterium]|nr:hypothetical protein [Bacteroidia bacterium]